MLWITVALSMSIVLVILFGGRMASPEGHRSDTADGCEAREIHRRGCRRFDSDSFRPSWLPVWLSARRHPISTRRNGITVKVTGYQWWWRVEYVHPEPQQYVHDRKRNPRAGRQARYCSSSPART